MECCAVLLFCCAMWVCLPKVYQGSVNIQFPLYGFFLLHSVRPLCPHKTEIFIGSLNHCTRLINVVAGNKLGSSDGRMSIPVSAAGDLWLVTAGSAPWLVLNHQGAADLVTAAQTGPIYQLIEGNALPAWVKGAWAEYSHRHEPWQVKGATRQDGGSTEKDLGSVIVSTLISLLAGCGIYN